MALDGTATGLIASIVDWLVRPTLAPQAPDFITLAEAQINRRLRVRRMIGSATTTISGEFASVPADFAGALTLTLDDGRQLDLLSPDALAEKKWLTQATSGEPQYYALVGDQLQFLPAPGDGYTALLTYYQMLPPLSANETNWLLTYAPDAYLYGALMQAAPYLKNDERIQTWGTLFTAALADLEKADRRESYGSRLSPQPSQPT